ncbi:MAG: hypothetical protein ACE5HU_04455, partial [Acidobacteriota bacterium]
MGKPVKILGIALNVALLVVALWPNGVLADPPQFIRYQAKLTDAAGVPLTGTHNLSFAIFDQVTAGGALWSEGPVAVNLASAGVDRLLGQVTPLTSAVLTAPARWLEVTVDGTVLSPRQRLASVPFAMVADRLGTMTLAQVQADVDARIGTHAANPAAHHIKTTDATELISGT